MTKHIDNCPDLAEEISYDLSESEGPCCRECRWAHFAEKGMYCSMHCIYVEGNFKCEDQEG
jgi:hypothetical protein